jgi:hypothetical protein
VNAIMEIDTLTEHGDWRHHAFRGPTIYPGCGGGYRVIGVRVPAPIQASAPVIDLFNTYRHGLPIQHGNQPWGGL